MMTPEEAAKTLPDPSTVRLFRQDAIEACLALAVFGVLEREGYDTLRGASERVQKSEFVDFYETLPFSLSTSRPRESSSSRSVSRLPLSLSSHYIPAQAPELWWADINLSFFPSTASSVGVLVTTNVKHYYTHVPTLIDPSYLLLLPPWSCIYLLNSMYGLLPLLSAPSHHGICFALLHVVAKRRLRN